MIIGAFITITTACVGAVICWRGLKIAVKLVGTFFDNIEDAILH